MDRVIEGAADERVALHAAEQAEALDTREVGGRQLPLPPGIGARDGARRAPHGVQRHRHADAEGMVGELPAPIQHQQVVAGAEVERVVARAVPQPAEGGDGVVARAAAHRVGEAAALMRRDAVVAGAGGEVQRLDAGHPGAVGALRLHAGEVEVEDQRSLVAQVGRPGVVACAARHPRLAEAAVEQVVARAAIQRVAPGAGDERVVLRRAAQVEALHPGKVQHVLEPLAVLRQQRDAAARRPARVHGGGEGHAMRVVGQQPGIVHHQKVVAARAEVHDIVPEVELGAAGDGDAVVAAEGIERVGAAAVARRVAAVGAGPRLVRRGAHEIGHAAVPWRGRSHSPSGHPRGPATGCGSDGSDDAGSRLRGAGREGVPQGHVAGQPRSAPGRATSESFRSSTAG
jgi:hypothetical protein